MRIRFAGNYHFFTLLSSSLVLCFTWLYWYAAACGKPYLFLFLLITRCCRSGGGDEALEEFLSFLGDKVELDGFDGYSGGLDTKRLYFLPLILFCFSVPLCKLAIPHIARIKGGPPERIPYTLSGVIMRLCSMFQLCFHSPNMMNSRYSRSPPPLSIGRPGGGLFPPYYLPHYYTTTIPRTLLLLFYYCILFVARARSLSLYQNLYINSQLLSKLPHSTIVCLPAR